MGIPIPTVPQPILFLAFVWKQPLEVAVNLHRIHSHLAFVAIDGSEGFTIGEVSWAGGGLGCGLRIEVPILL
jgi:hypothetical protein